ncbi:MAG: MnhB domain-containing protein [Eubacteriales bacterium]|nr:MnhB domain-containing protein [Eubacteriales bacterium]
MLNYQEPAFLTVEENEQGAKGRLWGLLALGTILLFGIVCAVRLGALAPTFDGAVDVAALEQNPTAYTLDRADGAAAVIVAKNLAETAAKNICFSVVFNFRGYDTMGESFILIAALAGSLCILRTPKKAAQKKAGELTQKAQLQSAEAENTAAAIRAQEQVAAASAPAQEHGAAGEVSQEQIRKEAAEQTRRPRLRSIVVRCCANLFLPLAITFGGYVILHGDSSPGGGFQGGVLVASAVLLVFLGYGTKKLSTTFRMGFLHDSETVAELLYIAIGLIGVLVGLDFAWNFMIDTLSVETAVLMNNAVGYHVMTGIGCLLIMMLGMLSTSEEE